MVALPEPDAGLLGTSHHKKGRKPFFVAPPHHIIASPDVCVLSHPIIPPTHAPVLPFLAPQILPTASAPNKPDTARRNVKIKNPAFAISRKNSYFCFSKRKKTRYEGFFLFFCPLMRPDKSPSRFFNSWTCKFNSWTCIFYSPCRNFHTPCERFHTPNGHSEARI